MPIQQNNNIKQYDMFVKIYVSSCSAFLNYQKTGWIGKNRVTTHDKRQNMSTKECDAISGGGTAENQLNSVNRVNKVEGGGEETGSYFSDGLRKIDIVLAYEGKVFA